MPAVGILLLVAIIAAVLAYNNWLTRGIRPREFVSNYSADQLRHIFTDKVAGMGWKVVDHDNPMVAQSPLLAGRRQQITLKMTREGNAIRCRIAPTRVWTKGWGGVPYKAHTLRMRLNAFERAASNGTMHIATRIATQSPQPAVQAAAAPTVAPQPAFAPPTVAPAVTAPVVTAPVVVAPVVVPPPVARADDHDGRTMTREQLAALRRTSVAIRLDTGAAITIAGPTVLGRNPASPAGSPPCAVHAIDDPEMSVSKTHLWLAVIDGELMIEDLGSSNGTVVVDASGARREALPGTRVAVPAGATVTIGDRSFRIE